MNLFLSRESLTVCQLPADAPIPTWAVAPASFLALVRTVEELTVVCPERLAPRHVKQEPGWCAFQVEGPLDFALAGILASIANPLAAAKISLFAVSTYQTDYVLVKNDQADAAVAVLQVAGHQVRR